jgi:hypothetical protein
VRIAYFGGSIRRHRAGERKPTSGFAKHILTCRSANQCSYRWNGSDLGVLPVRSKTCCAISQI